MRRGTLTRRPREHHSIRCGGIALPGCGRGGSLGGVLGYWRRECWASK
jgi:hypothetical protein